MALLRATLLIMFLGGAAWVCLLAGERAAALYEETLATRLAAALSALRLDWAEARVDGLRVALHGRAPDPHAQALARETVALAAPFAELADRSRAERRPPPARAAARLELSRDGLSVTVSGQLPDAATQAGLARAFAEEAPRLAIEDLSRPGAAPPDAPLALALAARAVAAVPRAHAVIEPGRLSVTGLARSEEAKAALARRLLPATPEGVQLDLALEVPPPVIAPFAVSVTLGEGGLLLGRCAARTPAEAAELAALLGRHGLRDVETPCPVGLGGPPGDWPGAIEAGLSALAELGGGRLEVAYRMAELTAPADTPEERLGALGAHLASALPRGYELRLRRAEAAPEAAARAEPGVAGRRFWLAFSHGAEGVVLAGLVPAAEMAGALETLARARFPGQVVHGALREAAAEPPEGWREAAFAALEALALLREGGVRVAAGRLLLEGRIEDPAAARPVHRTLERALPGLEVRTRLGVDLPSQVAAVELTGERCALLLNRLVRRRPLRFAPGSAVLEEDASATLDAAAELLRRCPGARLEIGGHTDSQGSEGFNLRLSRARAEAVRDALLARAIPLSRIAATGYGEAEPVASNETEAGRARNRRIAFAVLPAGQGEGG
jgi:OOP family OmpA-OmpF porin